MLLQPTEKKMILLIKGAGQLDIHMKKRTSYPIPYTKVNSRQAVGLNVRAKTECYKNIGEKSLTLG